MIEYFKRGFTMDPNLSIHKSLNSEKRRLQRAKMQDALQFNREFAEEKLQRTIDRNKFKTGEALKHSVAKNLEKRNSMIQNQRIDDTFVSLLASGFGKIVATACDVNPHMHLNDEIAKSASDTFRDLLTVKHYFNLEDVAKENPHFRVYLTSVADVARDSVAGNEEISNAMVLKETFENDVAEVINRKVLAMLDNEQKIEAARKEEVLISKNTRFPDRYMKAQAGRFNTFFKQILDNTIKEHPEDTDKMHQFLTAVGVYGALETLNTLKLVDRANFKLNTFGSNAINKVY